MRPSWLSAWISFTLVASSWASPTLSAIENEVSEFIAEASEVNRKAMNEFTIASWNYVTNVTDVNLGVKQETAKKLAAVSVEMMTRAKSYKDEAINDDLKRQLKYLGLQPLSSEEEEELGEVIQEMGRIYGSTEVCLPESDECLALDPGLKKIMSESTDYDQRLFAWKEWRRLVGRQIKPKYERYVDLKNKKAQLNGFKDYGDQWRSRYELENFEDMIIGMWNDLEPLYKELHAYIRYRLSMVYGKDKVDPQGKLPAHILGDMWGRFWSGLYKHVTPYPDKPNIDPSEEEMKAQNYTVEKMFKTADDFYASMGLLRVPPTFWNRSMLRKPDDGRQVICHATAWDFFDGEDFRIRMCAADYSFEDLNVIYHELGHTQYQQQYAHLPYIYRDGANDGFHEAIGELMAMTGANPKHLYKNGLMKQLVVDKEQDINFLLSQALITISTLPFHLVNDLWRWRAFRGDYNREDWNEEYWKLKESIVGVKSPVSRTKDDLDITALFHVNQDFDMIRYFTRTILQFQFQESLCKKSGHVGPLHRCDFSGSKEAGAALANMLKLGASKPWPEAMEQLTGTRVMSPKAIRNFFAPLERWLKQENKAAGNVPGWI